MTMRCISRFRTSLGMAAASAWIAGAPGCAFPTAAPAARLYVLTSPASDTAGAPPMTWWLTVDRPDADGSLDTRNIAVHTTAHRVAYYPRAAWPDPAPEMVRQLIVGAFRDTGRIAGVDPRPRRRTADYRLSLQLRAFHAVVPADDGAPDVRVTLTATLARTATGEVIGQRQFRAHRRATGRDVDRVVEAFDHATTAAIAQLVTWTLQRTRAAAARAPPASLSPVR